MTYVAGLKIQAYKLNYSQLFLTQNYVGTIRELHTYDISKIAREQGGFCQSHNVILCIQ